MSRYIDADACIADIEERLCNPCKEKGEDYHEVRCRACWVDDAIGEIDGYADNAIDIVRCKECEWLKVHNTKELYAECRKWHIRFYPFDEDTRTHGCSWGERRASDEVDTSRRSTAKEPKRISRHSKL